MARPVAPCRLNAPRARHHARPRAGATVHGRNGQHHVHDDRRTSDRRRRCPLPARRRRRRRWTSPSTARTRTPASTSGSHTLNGWLVRADHIEDRRDRRDARVSSRTSSIRPIPSPTVSGHSAGQRRHASRAPSPSAPNAADNVGVYGVQFKLDGAELGVEDLTAPYSVDWDTTTARQRLTRRSTAVARDAAGNETTVVRRQRDGRQRRAGSCCSSASWSAPGHTARSFRSTRNMLPERQAPDLRQLHLPAWIEPAGLGPGYEHVHRRCPTTSTEPVLLR